MEKPNKTGAASESLGEALPVRLLRKQIQELYLSDQIPWVVGYSGGKDSTATLQLVWGAISALPPEKWHKQIHVISTDTLVENPAVANWVGHSLDVMRKAVVEQGIPIVPHRLSPEVKDRFWVNLVGKGYPAPRPLFRWCTARLKISPSNKFIKELVQKNGEAILVLGTRKAESSSRAANMKRYEQSTRELLNRHGQLDRSWVYTPVANWTNDDVWEFLTETEPKNPWGANNMDLFNLYQGANPDGECPLVVDTSTQSCGDSRFGCFVCTMVDEDKSMQAMIKNDSEKEWMLPLLNLRNNYLGTKDDRKHRDFRRMNGSLLIYNGRLVHGPYTQSYRETVLKELLKAQTKVQANLPSDVPSFSLVTLEELEEIRRIWVQEKKEIEDSLPRIYQEATGKPYPYPPFSEEQSFTEKDIDLLKKLSTGEGSTESGMLHFQLVRELIATEVQVGRVASRSKLLSELDAEFEYGAFASAAEAENFALRREQARRVAEGEDLLPEDVFINPLGNEGNEAQGEVTA